MLCRSIFHINRHACIQILTQHADGRRSHDAGAIFPGIRTQLKLEEHRPAIPQIAWRRRSHFLRHFVIFPDRKRTPVVGNSQTIYNFTLSHSFTVFYQNSTSDALFSEII